MRIPLNIYGGRSSPQGGQSTAWKIRDNFTCGQITNLCKNGVLVSSYTVMMMAITQNEWSIGIARLMFNFGMLTRIPVALPLLQLLPFRTTLIYNASVRAVLCSFLIHGAALATLLLPNYSKYFLAALAVCFFLDGMHAALEDGTSYSNGGLNILNNEYYLCMTELLQKLQERKFGRISSLITVLVGVSISAALLFLGRAIDTRHNHWHFETDSVTMVVGLACVQWILTLILLFYYSSIPKHNLDVPYYTRFTSSYWSHVKTEWKNFVEGLHILRNEKPIRRLFISSSIMPALEDTLDVIIIPICLLWGVPVETTGNYLYFNFLIVVVISIRKVGTCSGSQWWGSTFEDAEESNGGSAQNRLYGWMKPIFIWMLPCAVALYKYGIISPFSEILIITFGVFCYSASSAIHQKGCVAHLQQLLANQTRARKVRSCLADSTVVADTICVLLTLVILLYTKYEYHLGLVAIACIYTIIGVAQMIFAPPMLPLNQGEATEETDLQFPANVIASQGSSDSFTHLNVLGTGSLIF